MSGVNAGDSEVSYLSQFVSWARTRLFHPIPSVTEVSARVNVTVTCLREPRSCSVCCSRLLEAGELLNGVVALNWPGVPSFSVNSKCIVSFM